MATDNEIQILNSRPKKRLWIWMFIIAAILLVIPFFFIKEGQVKHSDTYIDSTLQVKVTNILSDGNYSTMVLHDKTEHLFTFNLSHFQKLIEKQLKDDASQFIRIGKSLIINRDYIYRINLAKQQLVMSDMALNQAFMLSASKEALKQLKQLLENELK